MAMDANLIPCDLYACGWDLLYCIAWIWTVSNYASLLMTQIEWKVKFVLKYLDELSY